MVDKQNVLEKKVLRLQALCVMMILLGGGILLMGFTSQTKQKFTEIDVERINIVEKNGKLDMVISNEERQHPGISDGKLIERKSPRPPGIIFFNQLGDEMGGLIFGDNGGKGHFGSLTWDKVRNDQAVGFRYLESDNGTYQTGLEMWRRPNITSDEEIAKIKALEKIKDEKERKAAIRALVDRNELTTNQLFLGKRRDNSTMLLMNDIKGTPRIRMQVAPDGTPKLDFLDENGKVFYSLPDDAKAKK